MSASIASSEDGATSPRTSEQNPADPAPRLDSSAWRQTLTAAEAWELLWELLRERMRLAGEVHDFEDPEPGSPVGLFLAGGDPPPGWDLRELLISYGLVGRWSLLPPDATAADLRDHWGVG